MALSSYIGCVVSVSASTPATFDSSGYAALTWSVVGEVTSLGVIGDTSAAIESTTLAGRTARINGALDAGEVEFAFQFQNADAGQTILRAQSNGSTACSLRVADPDGSRIVYMNGFIANVVDVERSPTNNKGMTGMIRANSAPVRVNVT